MVDEPFQNAPDVEANIWRQKVKGLKAGKGSIEVTVTDTVNGLSSTKSKVINVANPAAEE